MTIRFKVDRQAKHLRAESLDGTGHGIKTPHFPDHILEFHPIGPYVLDRSRTCLSRDAREILRAPEAAFRAPCTEIVPQSPCTDFHQDSGRSWTVRIMGRRAAWTDFGYEPDSRMEYRTREIPCEQDIAAASDMQERQRQPMLSAG